MGAGITVEFNHPDSLIFIQNNIFHRNNADLGSGLNILHLSGSLVLIRNIFQENAAFTQTKVLIGLGAAFMISGSRKTNVFSINNIYTINEMENSGII